MDGDSSYPPLQKTEKGKDLITMNKKIFMDLLARKEFKAIRSILDVMNAVDIALLLSELEDRSGTAFRLIPKKRPLMFFPT